MGVPTSEVGYTPTMPRREDHEVHKGHVVALGGGESNGNVSVDLHPLFQEHNYGLLQVWVYVFVCRDLRC